MTHQDLINELARAAEAALADPVTVYDRQTRGYLELKVPFIRESPTLQAAVLHSDGVVWAIENQPMRYW